MHLGALHQLLGLIHPSQQHQQQGHPLQVATPAQGSQGSGLGPVQHPGQHQPLQVGHMNNGVQLQQDAGGYSPDIQAQANIPSQGADPRQIYMQPQLQGNRFNPGFTPLQHSNLRYQQNPQHPFSLF